ncbi:MAG: HlyD family efflux transporter periplasmic adaptor subunit [Gammaproteobacteria bacterium]|nr:HlyD family efflux transporter periplasmic adaptor subunit [Gammaproteobacteria bacterium]NIY10096.1 HlyD family efflux transporter periplasmic adaptor subunit [Gemmatimonadota bacterium]
MNRHWGKLVTGFLAVSVLGAAGVWAYDSSTDREGAPGMFSASGRLELRAVRPSSGTGGRIVGLSVREGQRIRSGDTLAVLDSRAQTTRLTAARAAAAAAQEAVVSAARQADAVSTRLEQARREAERYRRLLEREAVSRQLAEQAETAVEQLESQLRAARAAEDLARRRADAEAARVRVAEIELDETVIIAPVDGVVSELLLRQGEIAAPGYPIMAIRESGNARLQVYLPLDSAERVQTGDSARVFVDAYPDRSFPGTVETVASEAEFTPRDVHMPDERATLVYEVAIRVEDPSGMLKDGFPADAWIRWDPGTAWPESAPW